MKTLLLIVPALLAFSVFAPAYGAEEIPHNQKLGDAMQLLSDQMGGLGELSKKTPAEVDDKLFNRAMARSRGAMFILSVVNEKKGSIVDGKFVAGDLSPGKFLVLQGEELVTALTNYEGAIKAVSDVFAETEVEVLNQSKKAAQERDFRALKLLLVKLDETYKKAHKEFKPQPPKP